MSAIMAALLGVVVFLPALALGGGVGYTVFRLIRGARWPTLAGRYVAVALASILGLFLFLMVYWVLGLTTVLSHQGTPTTFREIITWASVMGPIYAGAILLRYTRIGRRLTRPIRWRRGA
jgi:hypothetical protein